MSKMSKNNITEFYGKIDNSREFDYKFWQQQSPIQIFQAAYEMICDYLLLKENNVNEPRLQRSVESFQKI